MLTHRMIKDIGLADNGSPTQANSVSPSSRHFLPCSAVDVAAEKLTDVIGDVVVDPAAQSGQSVEAGASNTARVQSFVPGGIAIEGGWDAIGSNDAIILVAGKARIDSGSSDSLDGGFISFYIGSASDVIFRVQPYYATFYDSNVSDPYSDGRDTIATPVDNNLLTRVDGQDYVFASVKRGDVMEHWADGIKTGENYLVNSEDSQMLSDWRNLQPGADFICSHGAYAKSIGRCDENLESTDPIGFDCHHYSHLVTDIRGGVQVPGSFEPLDGNTGVTGDYPQDYYGFLYMVFEDGAPNDVGEAMTWMLDDWKNNRVGEKRIYPGWMSAT